MLDSTLLGQALAKGRGEAENRKWAVPGNWLLNAENVTKVAVRYDLNKLMLQRSLGCCVNGV